jgi:hypothetical protein
MKTEIERVCEIMEMLLAHEPIIDVPYEQLNDIAVALVKEGYGDVKQAQIDVLNELKKKTHNYYPSIDSYCISQHIVLVRDIDELIKEAQNEYIYRQM